MITMDVNTRLRMRGTITHAPSVEFFEGQQGKISVQDVLGRLIPYETSLRPLVEPPKPTYLMMFRSTFDL